MDLTFKIKSSGLIEMVYQEKGLTVEKLLDLSQLVDLISSLKHEPQNDTEWLKPVILPSNAVAFIESSCSKFLKLVSKTDKEVFPFLYEDTLYNVPYPSLLFMFHISWDKVRSTYSLQRTSVAAIKDFTGMDTDLYKYPFSHVSHTSMCTGNIEKRETGCLSSFEDLPRHIITIPNGTHHWSSDNNLSSYNSLRDLLAFLDDKPVFPEKWLSPLNLTLENWLKQV